MPKACIFVDGENFRYSLAQLFPGKLFHFHRGSRYLPNADWHAFFKWTAEQCSCELLRTYWYVTANIDFRPWQMPQTWAEKIKLLSRWPELRNRIEKTGNELERYSVLKQIESEINGRRKAMEERWKGQRQILFSVESCNDRIEIRRSGSITYDLIEECFGTEKGVDTQLTTDLITMSSIYDVAIIFSGDADYLPPVAAVKTQGKLVYSVSFLDQKGEKLPGGARRLQAAVDSSYEIPFAEMLVRMGIRPRAAYLKSIQGMTLNSMP